MPAAEHRIVATPPDDLTAVLARLLVRYYQAEASARPVVPDFSAQERSAMRAAHLMAGEAIPSEFAIGPLPAWA